MFTLMYKSQCLSNSLDLQFGAGQRIAANRGSTLTHFKCAEAGHCQMVAFFEVGGDDIDKC